MMVRMCSLKHKHRCRHRQQYTVLYNDRSFSTSQRECDSCSLTVSNLIIVFTNSFTFDDVKYAILQLFFTTENISWHFTL